MYKQILTNMHKRQNSKEFSLAAIRYKNERSDDQKSLDCLARVLSIYTKKVCVAIAYSEFDDKYYISYNANGSLNEYNSFKSEVNEIIRSFYQHVHDNNYTIYKILTTSILTNRRIEEKLRNSIINLDDGYIELDSDDNDCDHEFSKILSLYNSAKNTRTKETRLEAFDLMRDKYKYLCQILDQISQKLETTEDETTRVDLVHNYSLIKKSKSALSPFYKVYSSIEKLLLYFNTHEGIDNKISVINNRSGPNNQKHTEMCLLEHIHRDYKNRELFTHNIYIGISKLACLPCKTVIALYNKYSDDNHALNIKYHGTHGKVYENWEFPVMLLDVISIDEFVSALNPEDYNAYAVMPMGPDTTSSDSDH